MEAGAAGAVGGGIGDPLLWAPNPSVNQAVGVSALPGRKGDPGPAPQAVSPGRVHSPAACQHEGHAVTSCLSVGKGGTPLTAGAWPAGRWPVPCSLLAAVG